MIEQLEHAIAAGDRQQAMAIIGDLSQQQNTPHAQISLVNLCLKQGFYDLSVECFAKAADEEAVAMQVISLVNEPSFRDNIPLATAFLHAAHTAQPDNLQLIITLSDHLLATEQYQAAEKLLSDTLTRRPHAEVLARLAEAYYRQQKLHDAKACATLGVEFAAGNPKSYINLAVIEKALANLPEAARQFSKALELDPENFFAHINLSHLSLMCGEFELGWQENEWRWQDRHCIQESIPLPLWQGEQSQQLHLLLWADQGLGDQIMYLTLLERIECQITVKVDPRLVPLLPKTIQALPTPYTGDYSEFDAHLSLGSIPKYLIHSFNDFSPVSSFLVSDFCTEKSRGPNQRIGFSWRGGRYGTERENRSIAFDYWHTLTQIPGVQWVNLQYDTSAQERQLLAELGVETPDIDLKADLVEQAKCLLALDSYIGVDNSTLHLAGALGVTSTLLLPAVADWRWFTESKLCYWYQSVTLNRLLPLTNSNKDEIQALLTRRALRQG